MSVHLKHKSRPGFTACGRDYLDRARTLVTIAEADVTCGSCRKGTSATNTTGVVMEKHLVPAGETVTVCGLSMAGRKKLNPSGLAQCRACVAGFTKAGVWVAFGDNT